MIPDFGLKLIFPVDTSKKARNREVNKGLQPSIRPSIEVLARALHVGYY